ncbi:hypothetical protein [Halegenticoccus soli]|uniref:hypothetical protein n=1 Tax=Halegenticoccus soli TaxID=1985678 RepID=UPI000C6E3C02|nr:hypothetical protein [Halegenticoccus soli]
MHVDGVGVDPFADDPLCDPLAVLFGYACHATTLLVDRYSGDWPGYAVEYLRERYPGATVAYLPGCGGDQNPYPRRSLELAKQHGRTMANAVTAAVEAARRPVRGPLRLVYEEPTLRFDGPPTDDELARMRDSDDPFWSRHGELLAEERERTGDIRTEYPYPMQAVGFGTDLTMLALAGEAVVDYALLLKDRFDGPLWVAAYANDGFTYVPTARVLSQGGYEGGEVTKFRRYPGRLDPSVEARVLRNAEALIERVR